MITGHPSTVVRAGFSEADCGPACFEVVERIPGLTTVSATPCPLGTKFQLDSHWQRVSLMTVRSGRKLSGNKGVRTMQRRMAGACDSARLVLSIRLHGAHSLDHTHVHLDGGRLEEHFY